MVFSSSNFLFFFFPIALAIGLLARGRTFLFAILVLSLVFYFWSSGPYIFVLGLSMAFGYFGALLVDRYEAGSPGRRAALATAATLLVANLVFFKYLGFAATNIDALISTNLVQKLSGIVLPIGISFFTFQALSYLIDVYRNDIPVERSSLLFCSYLTFFPHLIAGPIVRYRDVVGDFRDPKISVDDFAVGISRFVHGLLKKVIIADAVAPIPDAIFGAPTGTINFATAWLGAAAYAIQIYFDFSAYSDMAIGLARMFGIRFMENFNRPYSSCSITEFWRRWHISLSSWFRDYLYIPLGGNRRGSFATYSNLIIVFAITGLWHGAAWTFLAWGLYQGAFLIVERAAFAEPVKALGRPWIRYIYCLPVVLIGWIVFRASSLDQAATLWDAMATPLATAAFTIDAQASGISPVSLAAFLVGATVFVLPGRESFGQMLMHQPGRPAFRALNVGYIVVALIWSSVVVLSGNYSPFLYFRF